MTRLPMVCPARPLSKPGITASGLASMTKPNGALLDHVSSKTLPVRQIKPVYWVTTNWPLASLAPLPLIRVVTVRFFGGFLPLGIVTVGAVPAAGTLTVGSEPPPFDTWVPVALAVLLNSLTRSITNTSVSVPVMPSSELPAAPNPSLGGMTASTRLPTVASLSAVDSPGSSEPVNSDGVFAEYVLVASLCVVPLQTYAS